ncbi:hypothetical protein QTG54_015556 [Skeletonema marinoi]|uniref:Uncharacterized protein n=1 Tax=Skeletonema marinoi TaxID=267567 RepID=A0AAD8XTQ2_9STRA|nr:hypothetical protein QTG54_015556 [Skeletonema marinoi]
MVYCPRSIMEGISSSNHPSAAAAAAAANEDDGGVVVPFPSLNPNPPTDSEEGTVEEEATAAAAASSTDDGHGDDEGASAGESSSSVDDQREEEDDSLNTNEKKRSMSSSSSSSCSSSTTTCEEHGGACCCPPIPNLVGASDPSSIMKTYLNELVAYLKVQKEQHLTNNNEGGENWNTRNNNSGDKKKKRRKLEQQQLLLRDGEKMSPASSSSTAASNSSKQSSTMSYQEEKSSKEPIDTIMHWMDSFQDDETIQLMCLQSLPTVLEDPILRRTAQSDGLASIVLYDMAAFPSNSLLILTAFHTLVVLLRPLGTNEGMVHKASSVAMTQRSTMSCTSSKGIRSISKMSAAAAGASSSTTEATAAINSVNFKGTTQHSKRRSNSTSSSSSVISNTQLYDPSMKNQLTNWEENGVRVMLDSLRRFSNDRYLQAMGCWAMVNAALYPSLKSGLTRLGGVYAVTNAMMLHPNAEAVQFRGLFALINLVIPERDSNNERSGSSIHSHVYQIARLTILAMKNFHTNKSILNRGCLVLRNLSLTPSFVKILGRTPGCVDMLLHCRQICPRDALVQRSARTIMVMIQRATEKEQLTTMKNNAHDRHLFTLTQPFPVPSREAVDRSTSTTPTLSLGESQQKR